MPDIKHPDNIEYVEPGDKQISASGYNGLIQSARRVQSFRRGITNSSDIKGDKDSSSIRYSVRGIAKEDIPEYSVFTIETGGDPWTYEEPTPLLAKYTIDNAAACVFLANQDDALFEDGDYYLPVCDFTEPYIFKYDPADGVPDVGDRIGPKLNSFIMSLAGDNLSFTVISPPDTTDSLVWCIKGCIGSEEAAPIPMFEFTEELYPGYVANARKLKWDPTSKTYILDIADTKEYKIFDPEEQNMFLPFERVHAIRKPLKDSLGAVFSDYEIIGEHGLHRKVLVNGAVDCGQTGDTFVYTNNTKIHPPPKHPTDPDCDLAGSSAQLKACNKYGYRRKIEDQEIATVDWDVGRQAWVFEQEDRGNVIEASLSGVMCGQDTTVAVTGARYFDWQGDTCSLTPDPDVTSVTNSKSLAGPQGATVFCHRKENTIGADEWHIFEVKHRDFFLLRPDGGGQGVCPEYVIKQREFAVMTCEEIDDDYIRITSTPTTVVSDVLIDSNCGATILYQNICVLDVSSGGSTTIPMAKVNFLTGVSTSSDCNIDFTGESGCVFHPGAGTGGNIPVKQEVVGYAISEAADPGDPQNEDCVLLDRKTIPVIDCNNGASDSQVIVCLKDCEDTPTTVVSEANTAGTYTPTNKQTQPYNTETNNLNDDDIIIQFPASPLEGEVIAIANNTMEETTVKIDGNGNNVQALSAPYTAATVSIGAPMLNVTYMARLIGASIQWRII